MDIYKKEEAMKELMRSNNPVEIAYAQALLADSGIGCVLLDQHAAALDGSIGALPRRLCVGDDDLAEAQTLLRDAGLLSVEQ